MGLSRLFRSASPSSDLAVGAATMKVEDGVKDRFGGVTVYISDGVSHSSKIEGAETGPPGTFLGGATSRCATSPL